MADFADRLKLYRTMYDLTMEELAKRLNTQKQVIHRYETRQQVPKIDTVSEYAKIMNVTVPWLIGYDEVDNDPRTQKEKLLCDRIKRLDIKQICALIVIADSMTNTQQETPDKTG